jgi:predicted DCC family thiol-disulfide oxidoreductase YuxK
MFGLGAVRGKADTGRRFKFMSIESPYGNALALTLGIDLKDPDTNAVFLNGRAHRRSDAALTVLAILPRWGWVRFLRPVPRAIRDFV